jgi:PEP-CTERM motif-containing protein
MRAIFELVLIALLLGFFANFGFAGPTCVTNNSSSGWVSIGTLGASCTSGNQLPATFVLPEPESDTAPEAVGDFIFNKAFGGGGGNKYITMQDVTGAISDYFLVGNTGPGGVGEILFYSDPAAPTEQLLANYTFGGVLCDETAGGGCVAGGLGYFTDGSIIAATFASDGDTGTFDPFNSGMNTSDGIQFTNVPEPSTLMMAAGGLLLLGLARRRARQ